MKAFGVMYDGHLVFEIYGQGMQKDDIQLLQSTSKTFTGMLVHRLAQKGALRLDGQVKDYLPDLRAGVFDGATLQHLLDMQVGFPGFGSYHNPDHEGFLSEVYMGLKPKCIGVTRQSTKTFLRRFKEPVFSPGSRFEYNDMNNQALAMVAEAATNKRYAELIEEHFWIPLAARYNAAVSVDEDGNAGSSFGMAITLRDAMRFGQMMLDRGKYAGQEVIPESYFVDTFDVDLRPPALP